MASMRMDLLQFLKQAVHISHSRRLASWSPIFVLGNPSADLDSIISAILYSYFASYTSGGKTRQYYIPIVNLPDVHSGQELRRLRPEFATALRLATSTESTPHSWQRGHDHDQQVLENATLEEAILTIADLKERLLSKDAGGHSGEGQTSAAAETTLDVVLVDWNSLPLTSVGPNTSMFNAPTGVYEGLRLSILGCIDHHEDESFIPYMLHRSNPSTTTHWNEPRCIQTGVGSCTSLVVRELRSRGIWGDDPRTPEFDPSGSSTLTTLHEAQAAKLALAAILADTANMTAESKVSDVDRAAVSFLEGKIRRAFVRHQRGTSSNNKDIAGIEDNGWNRQEFYEEIMHAKSNSVENLTMDEVLGRDYKEWTEVSQQSGDPVKIGICNVVRPISWIVSKASQSPRMEGTKKAARRYHALFEHLSSFSRARGLDIVVLMTAFNGPPPTHNFKRELLVWDLNDRYRTDLELFESIARSELGIVPWRLDQTTTHGDDFPFTELRLDGTFGPNFVGIWSQRDVSKSRKQIAPLLRNVLSGKLSRF
ncbi:hypothetical protein VTO42DRAFT_6778 [Malbranchea cinnamomea]